MVFRAKTDKSATLRRLVAAAMAGGLILGAVGCLIDSSGATPDVKAQAPAASVATQPVINVAVEQFHKTIKPILTDRCYSCHSGQDNHTGIAFDALTTNDSLVNNPELWLKVLKNTRSHVMPPPDNDPPTPEQQLALENWIEYSAFGVNPDQLDPGRQTIRRLNRAEYHNTIQALLGVDFDVETQLPADDIGYGFDNIGDVLNVSPMLMEKYVQAAQTIVSQGVEVNSSTLPVITVAGNRFSDAAANANFGAPSGARGGRGGRGGAGAGGAGGAGGGILDMPYSKPSSVTHTFDVVYEGDYNVILDWNIKGSFNFAPDRCTIAYAVDGVSQDPKEFGWHDDYNSSDQFAVHWTPGKHSLTVTLNPIKLQPTTQTAPKSGGTTTAPPALLADAGKPANLDGQQLALADAPNTTNANVPQVGAVAGVGAGAGGAPKPDAVVAPRGGRGGRGGRGFVATPPPTVSYRITKVRLAGPQDEAHWTPSPGYKKFFPRAQIPKDEDGRRQYARQILLSFATKAFRRPVPDETINRLVDIAVSVGEAPNGTFEKGIAQAMVATLASPRFIYRVETAEPAEANSPFANCDEYTLASRLSYFLWSTMPDDELINLAANHQLRKNLRAEINRMLADPRSQALVQNFTGQWLQSRDAAGIVINVHEVGLREGITAAFNAQMPGPVRVAMQQEPEAYFAYVMHEDRSVKEFIDSDYTFVNQTLAQFYKIDGVTGNQMQKVTLPPGDLRGGALTMGATLIVTSNPTRTSPVKRGKWVLENILGAPTPPPPPDIPPLELAEKQFKDQKPNLRQVLAAHRANPQCASCHDRMDPLGLALENFNAEGLYRNKELDQPIDASGQLFTGEKFKDVSELKHALVQNHVMEFYRCLTEKLLIYATGRGMEYYDMPTIDKITDQLNQSDGRFSALLLGVIDSAPFQERRVANK